MISLDNLRKRSGLLMGGIGVAMGAFLLGDLFSSGSSLLNGGQGVIGVVDDQVIEYREFETEAQNLDRIFNSRQDRNVLRDNLWNDKVNDVVMGKQYSELGLSISAEELAGLAFGYKSGEMSTTAKQFFGITGQDVTPAQLAGVIQQIHDNDPQRWMYFENVIRKERLGQKYLNAIRQGLSASSIDAENYYQEQGTQASGRYVFKAFDTKIEVSDAEVSSYYNAHNEEYPQNASRELSIAVFEIVPTQADKNTTKSRISDLIEDKTVFNKTSKANEVVSGFSNTSDAISFVNTYSDASFDTTFYADGQLSPAIELEMRTAELGYVFGPYEEDNNYKLAKLNDRRGDSVQVAIISIAIDASEETANEIYAQASEMAVAKDMDGFETLADEKNIALTAATVLEADRSIAGLGEARNLVFWAYNTETAVNMVKLDDQNNRIVVMMLAAITPEGTQPLEEVKTQVEIALKKEKSGKALLEEFNTTIGSATTIEEVATAMDLKTEQVNTMSFSSNAIPGGFEPNVVGAFYGIEKGQLSKPVIGNNGVYVVYADDFIASKAPKDLTSLKKQLDGQIKPRANFEATNALRELTDIEDNRAKFY
ncbi:SurA N-terminal domain-containing protein [Flavobacteriales bacterium]|nr:SurA N-terminal domain-containing protein [Flavobacteriales bacterium]